MGDRRDRAWLSGVEAITWLALGECRTTDHFQDAWGEVPVPLRVLPPTDAELADPGLSPDERALLQRARAVHAEQALLLKRLNEAEDELFEAARVGRITLYGIRTGARTWEPIPSLHFLHPVAIYLGTNALGLAGDVPVGTMLEHWRTPEWRELRVKTADLRRLAEERGRSRCPALDRGERNQHPDPYRTGAPGRPTIMHLALAELEWRGAAGELAPTLAAETRALKAWAAETHPSAPLLSLKALENGLREPYRRLKRQTPLN